MICDWSIGDLPGLNDTERALLIELGIATTSQLLTVAPDAATKQKLAHELGYQNPVCQ